MKENVDQAALPENIKLKQLQPPVPKQEKQDQATVLSLPES